MTISPPLDGPIRAARLPSSQTSDWMDTSARRCHRDARSRRPTGKSSRSAFEERQRRVARVRAYVPPVVGLGPSVGLNVPREISNHVGDTNWSGLGRQSGKPFRANPLLSQTDSITTFPFDAPSHRPVIELSRARAAARSVPRPGLCESTSSESDSRFLHPPRRNGGWVVTGDGTRDDAGIVQHAGKRHGVRRLFPDPLLRL